MAPAVVPRVRAIVRGSQLADDHEMAFTVVMTECATVGGGVALFALMTFIALFSEKCAVLQVRYYVGITSVLRRWYRDPNAELLPDWRRSLEKVKNW